MDTEKQSINDIPLKMPEGIEVVLDEHVALVLEFMQLNLPGSKLVKVAKAVAELGEIFFRRLDGPDLIEEFENRFIAAAIYRRPKLLVAR